MEILSKVSNSFIQFQLFVKVSSEQHTSPVLPAVAQKISRFIFFHSSQRRETKRSKIFNFRMEKKNYLERSARRDVAFLTSLNNLNLNKIAFCRLRLIIIICY